MKNVEDMEKTGKIHYTDVDTPIGKMFLGSLNNNICCVTLKKERISFLCEKTGLTAEEKRTKPLKKLTDDLERYFSGEKIAFKEAVVFLYGTSLERRVWRATMQIPWGETRSYKWVSMKAGLKNGWRIVGRALSKNPLLIIVPCHRVIKSNGSLGGFTPGLNVKRKLLNIEKSIRGKHGET